MFKSTKAQNIAEWGIAVVLISTVVMVALFAFVPSSKGILYKISNAMDQGLNNN